MNPYKTLCYSFSIVAILILVTGCSRVTVNLSEWIENPETQSFEIDRQIITDKKLAKIINMEAVTVTTTPGDLLKVQFRLQNLTGKMQSIEYKVEWVDSDGMAFETPSSRWIIAHIYGGDSIFVSSVSPNASIDHFIVKLKRRK